MSFCRPDTLYRKPKDPVLFSMVPATLLASRGSPDPLALNPNSARVESLDQTQFQVAGDTFTESVEQLPFGAIFGRFTGTGRVDGTHVQVTSRTELAIESL